MTDMAEGGILAIDYTGEQGGQLSLAFAAGCMACTAFWGMIGRFMWSVLGKAKDDTIAELKKTIEKNEERCAETIDALSDRVKQLETLLLLHGPGDMRQDLQRALAEMELRLQTSGVKP